MAQNTNKPLKPALRKTAVISSCDCLVGFLSGERVSKSTIDYEVKRISDIQPKFKEYGKTILQYYFLEANHLAVTYE
jgi:hypothetical protein